MTALPAVPSVVRTELFYTNNATTGTILNRLFFKYTGGAGTDTTMATLADNISGYWGTHVKSLVVDEAALSSVKCVDLSSATAPLGEYVTPVPGTSGGSSIPASTAFLVTYQIARRYRGGKPKSFLPIGAQSDLADVGAWSTTFISNVQTQWNAFIAAVLADTSAVTFTDQVNVSYYGPPNVPITNPVTGRTRTVSTLRTVPLVDTIIGTTYEAELATQKRRIGRKR